MTRSASGTAASRAACSAPGPECWLRPAGSCPSGRWAAVGQAPAGPEQRVRAEGGLPAGGVVVEGDGHSALGERSGGASRAATWAAVSAVPDGAIPA